MTGPVRAGAGSRIAMIAVAIVGMCAQSLIFTALPAALPAIAAHFGDGAGGAFTAQMVMTMPSLGMVIGGLVAGRILDRGGLRAVLLAALALYGLTGGAGLILDDARILLGCRLLTGFANACLSVACITFVMTEFPAGERERALSWQGAGAGVTGIAAVFVGGLLVQWGGWRAPFLLYPLLVAPALLCALAVVPRHGRIPAAAAPAAPKAAAAIWPILLMLVPVNIISVTSAAQLPFLMAEKALRDPFIQSIAIGGGQTAHIPGALLFPLVLRRLGSRGTQALCAALLGAGMIGCAFAAGLWTMLASNFLFALAIGMLMPYFPYLIATRAGEATRNRALGLMTTAIFTGIFINPPLIALLRTALSLSAIYSALGAMLAAIAIAMALSAARGPRGGRPFTTSLKTRGGIC